MTVFLTISVLVAVFSAAAAVYFGCRSAAAEKKLQALRDENTLKTAQIAGLEAQDKEARRQLEEKIQLLDTTREKIQTDFKLLAAKILEENNKKLMTENRSGLENVLKPLGERLKDFEKKVDESYEKTLKDRGRMFQELDNLQKLNVRLSKDAEGLTSALKGDNKLQGNWGEMILERVLECSGLRNGEEYELQKSFTLPGGRRLQPDAVVHLPENREIIIDSKVSLNAYERYTSSSDDEKRKKHLREHVSSLQSHIRELSGKDYQNLFKGQSLDFVLMFIPVEPALGVALQADSEMFFQAFKSNIMIVTPSTLLTTLRMIAHLWRQEKQNRNVAEIARVAGALYDKFCNFVKDLQGIGQRLDQAHASYDEAFKKLKGGAGNLIRTTEKIRELGAKTKKQIDDKLLEDSGE